MTLEQITALVDQATEVVERVTFDESGAMVAGKWMGGNGGLISRETIAAVDELRRILKDLTPTLAAPTARQQKREPL